MTTTSRATVLLTVLSVALAGCSKAPTPSSNTATPAIQRGRELALAPIAPPHPPTPAAGETAVSPEEQVTAIIRRAGFTTYEAFNGARYLRLIDRDQAAQLHLPLPNGLKVYYLLQHGQVVLAADLRPLRPTESEAIADALNTGLVASMPVRFGVAPAPAQVNGRDVMQESLYATIQYPAATFTAATLQDAIGQYALMLTPNQELWR
jgi:hypothetical protein